MKKRNLAILIVSLFIAFIIGVIAILMYLVPIGLENYTYFIIYSESFKVALEFGSIIFSVVAIIISFFAYESVISKHPNIQVKIHDIDKVKEKSILNISALIHNIGERPDTLIDMKFEIDSENKSQDILPYVYSQKSKSYLPVDQGYLNEIIPAFQSKMIDFVVQNVTFKDESEYRLTFIFSLSDPLPIPFSFPKKP